ncbi:MAG: hypothetical protein QG585_666 [Patescibacteria group bacterium]|jgi:hypothetical protein|nr:hypothetical protein [Patescibacteria group bacterium]
METYFISCEPQNTEEVITIIKERPGYKFLGQASDNQMVFSVEAVTFHEAYKGLVRLASIKKSNPLDKREVVEV